MDFPCCRRQSTPQVKAVAAEGDACAPSLLDVKTRVGGTEGSGSQWQSLHYFHIDSVHMYCGQWSKPQGLVCHSFRQWTRSFLLLWWCYEAEALLQLQECRAAPWSNSLPELWQSGVGAGGDLWQSLFLSPLSSGSNFCLPR